MPTTPQATCRLVIDCAASGLAMALHNPATGKVEAFASAEPRASDVLPQQLHELLGRMNITAAHIGAVGVTVGPGSFTGSRLGLAAAEALKLANPHTAITGLSTLQALALQIAEQHNPHTHFTILLDAAGQQAYTQTFTPGAEPVAAAQCLPLAEAAAAQGPIFAQAGLMLPPPAQSLGAINPEVLLTMLGAPRYHLEPQPVYLKPLTYRRADA